MFKYIFYILYFIYSIILSDLTVYCLFTINKVNVYAVDIFYIIIIIMILAIKRGVFLKIKSHEKVYYIFLFLLFLQILRGFIIYGFSSIGEARFIASLYMSFVPFVFFYGHKFKENDLYEFIEKCIFIAGIAGLIMFIIEYLYGGRYFLVSDNKIGLEFIFDPRGIRYLDVYHVYNMVLLALYIVLKTSYSKRTSFKSIFLSGILIVASLISQGRTSIISLLASFTFILLLNGRLKLILYSVIIGVISLIIFFLIEPASAPIFFTIISDYRSVIEPVADFTGTGFWRWALNAAALEQAMQTFWLGQGYGGYYYFDIPILSALPIEVAPHNMYIVVWLKNGIIGLAILIFFLFIYSLKLIKVQRSLFKRGYKKKSFYVSIILLIIISQMPYGLSYSFIQVLGLYSGMGFILLRNLKDNEFENNDNKMYC